MSGKTTAVPKNSPGRRSCQAGFHRNFVLFFPKNFVSSFIIDISVNEVLDVVLGEGAASSVAESDFVRSLAKSGQGIAVVPTFGDL